MATVQQITTDIQAVQAIADTILSGLSGLEPEATVAEGALDIVSQLVTAALTAYSNASGTPITVESVQALMPDQDPLPPPTT